MGTEEATSVARDASKRHAVKAHVAELIANGTLRRGSRVPSLLDLARHLGVAKNTVIGALDELCGEGCSRRASVRVSS